MAGLRCGGCGTEVGQNYWNLPSAIPCLNCSRPLQALVFPAAWRPAAGTSPERVAGAGEANCYEHESNRAVTACDACGRFLCSLCDLEVSGMHVCPACYQAGKAAKVAQGRVQRHVHHDSIALALATLPVMFCWVALLTTPYAVFHAFLHWRDGSPVIPRGKWRLWLTLLSAAAQVALVGALIYFIANQPRPGV